MEENKKTEVPDIEARLADIIIEEIRKAGIESPEELCGVTMNTCTRIFGIVATFLQMSPKEFILKLLHETIRQIEEHPDPVPEFEVEKGEI
jgi:hypothetical protein